MTGDRRWEVRLTPAADNDTRDILRWTEAHFGTTQARVYADTLGRATDALKAGPHVAGARVRNDLGEGIMALHVARQGRRGRHLVFYRIGSPAEPPMIDVLRILHDSMDPTRHLAHDASDGL